MAGRISDEDIALVRERSPIADVVGEHIQLRNAGGGNLKGLCPFHEEKTPSFNVTPARGYWYCFGCGEGGDVITFIRRLEHLTFTEAIERLAQRAGIQLRYERAVTSPAGSRASASGCWRRTAPPPSSTPSTCPLPRPRRDGGFCPSAASNASTPSVSASASPRPNGTG